MRLLTSCFQCHNHQKSDDAPKNTPSTFAHREDVVAKKHFPEQTVPTCHKPQYCIVADGLQTRVCSCRKTFTGEARNAKANLKRHILSYEADPKPCCHADHGCSYKAVRSDHLKLHERRCTYK